MFGSFSLVWKVFYGLDWIWLRLIYSKLLLFLRSSSCLRLSSHLSLSSHLRLSSFFSSPLFIIE